MENTLIKDADLEGLLREIDLAEARCEDTLKRLRKQRLELTGENIIEFTISTIHKDRRGIVLNKILSVDKTQTYNKLLDQWKASAQTDQGCWIGEVQASGSKEKLLSVMHKIAKEGGTITVDPIHKIEVPPPDLWWDAEWWEKMEAAKEAAKEAKRNTKASN